MMGIGKEVTRSLRCSSQEVSYAILNSLDAFNCTTMSVSKHETHLFSGPGSECKGFGKKGTGIYMSSKNPSDTASKST